MKKILLIPCLAYTWMFALDHSQIISDFGIRQNNKNLSKLDEISSSISASDRSRFRTIIRTQQKNTNLIKNQLENLNAPEFMLYLAMVESKLSENVSNGGTKGVWQFQAGTARKFGLQVSKGKDERKDVEKSTKAAYKYMKYLKSNFGNWYLALMAYNCGEGCISKVIQKTGSRDFNALMSSNALPDHTKDFMKRIMQYAYVGNSKANQTMMAYLGNKKFKNIKKIKLNDSINLASVSKKLNISLVKLKQMNNTTELEAKNYLYIPENKLELYIANFGTRNSSFAENKSKIQLKKHRI